VNATAQNWLGGTVVIVGTVLVELAVQMLLARMFAAAARGGAQARTPDRVLVRSLPVLSLCAVFALVFGHLSQVFLWTLLYLALGELDGFADAAYFSLASYTTVGAAELELSRGHRVLGALESAVGIIMFGWSTALLVALVERSGR